MSERRLQTVLLGVIAFSLVLYGLLTFLPPDRTCYMTPTTSDCTAKWGPVTFPVPYFR